MYKQNAYHEALYSAISERYTAVRGDVEAALERLRSGTGRLLHIHWEEHSLRNARTRREATAIIDLLCEQIEEFKQDGGKIFWTVHNVMPHEMEHPDAFLSFRRRLGKLSDGILVHTPEAVSVLAEQGIQEPLKIILLPHPSYVDMYPADASAQGAERGDHKIVLVFGLIRRYKAIHRVIESFSDKFARENRCRLEIVGKGVPGDSYPSEISALAARRKHVTFREEHIPDTQIGPIMGSAECVILPYERLLTSGVAMLALSYGTIVVGPRLRQLEEVYPPATHRFFFQPGDDDDMMRAVAETCNISQQERAVLKEQILDRARYLHPHRISLQLGDLYDATLGLGSR
ncbi:glycosyltransferase [Pseudoxanthobacter sp. M-2]|uniref:glycosyltransferase n=1 Tax=Pseudoxanthobacter sp. M-2 TaxID=3078754 RepID=UPI0038FC123E